MELKIKIIINIFIVLFSTFSFSQDKLIIQFTKFEEGDTYVLESPIILKNLAIKGDTIVGYTDVSVKKSYLSYDNGKNWKEQKISLKNESNFNLKNIFWVGNKLFLLGNNSHKGIYDNYIFSSIDVGKTWQIVNENLPFYPDDIYYSSGKFFIRTLGEEGISLNKLSGGLYASNDCKNWNKISTDEIKNISDFYFEKDEVYVNSSNGLYKYSIKEDNWTNVTKNLKSNFNENLWESSKIVIVADKCYSIFENILQEYNLTTREIKEIQIPEEYQSNLATSIYSYKGILFLCNYKNLIYYKNDFIKFKNESIKKYIQDVFYNSGGLKYLKFNNNELILNGTLSFPFSAFESNEDFKPIVSKATLFRNNNLLQDNIVNLKIANNSSNKVTTNISHSYIKSNSTQIDCSNKFTQSTVRPSYYEYRIFTLQEIPNATINEICRINNTSTNEIIKRNGSVIGYSIYQFSPKGKRLKDVTMDLNGKIMQKMIYQYDNNNEAKYLFKINYLDEIIFMKAKENNGFKDIEFNGPYPKTIENALRRYKSPERTYFSDPCNECRSKGYKFGQRCIICGGSGKVSHGIIKY